MLNCLTTPEGRPTAPIAFRPAGLKCPGQARNRFEVRHPTSRRRGLTDRPGHDPEPGLEAVEAAVLTSRWLGRRDSFANQGRWSIPIRLRT